MRRYRPPAAEREASPGGRYFALSRWAAGSKAEVDVSALFDVNEHFTRWDQQMSALDVAYAAPKPEPLVAGAGPSRPVSPQWKAEMRRRRDLLHPLALEMAQVYRLRLDDSGRRRAQALLAEHPLVMWQFEGVVFDFFERFMHTMDQADLAVALALTAIYDARAQSRDFHRFIYPYRIQMKKQGLDAAAIFDDALSLATRHDDPRHGAYGLFVDLGPQWDREPEPRDSQVP